MSCLIYNVSAMCDIISCEFSVIQMYVHVSKCHDRKATSTVNLPFTIFKPLNLKFVVPNFELKVEFDQIKFRKIKFEFQNLKIPKRT